MNQQQAKTKYEELGKAWLEGARITEWTFPDGKTIKLLPSQIEFLNSKKRYCFDVAAWVVEHTDLKEVRVSYIYKNRESTATPSTRMPIGDITDPPDIVVGPGGEITYLIRDCMDIN